ncbi:sulfonate ABC transporter substrate-binding protein [Curvibacter sp. CHRR-16]|uniref:sulfonate ABC transporter substrate-binding protein n=1 Tax=Curvibacter sp. CHRR-16 TaxID=2835872 RepID=UPI001BDA6625|nr:sulfonate ABC transporter substrate-binding protein [Curvibacter sp. CHRR-16]MBT0570182.1 sulfonate ABC transporter substrate-binding protein [Curvibacter sp. CHRR-16]
MATTAALWGLHPPTHAHSTGKDASPTELRIGYQKGSLALVVLKDSGKLAQRLKGSSIRWVEFNAGPPLLEALAVGSIDIGATGDAPPVFAQAADKDLVYVAYEAPAPEGSAVVVPSDSSIRTLADLKGKRVAFTKGSSAHFLIAQGLRKGGLTLADIQPVYLSPSDARAAFEGGNVDAWVIWDPYYAAVELTGKARVLATSKGLSSGNSFFLASNKLVQQYPAAVSAIVDELNKAAKLKPQEVTQLITKNLGLEPAVVERYVQRRPGSPIRLLTPEVIAEQQGVADVFYQAKVIPKPVRVADAVWNGPAKK